MKPLEFTAINGILFSVVPDKIAALSARSCEGETRLSSTVMRDPSR